MRLDPTPIALLLPILLAGCAGLPREEKEGPSVEYLLDHHEFTAAVEEAARIRDSRPGDADAEEQHLRASVAYMIEQGRRATFLGQDEEALAAFETALELDPGNDLAEIWRGKTRRKLSENWLIDGTELHAGDNLEGAYEAYMKALEYDPDLLPAREGAGQVLLRMNYRRDLGVQYYRQGVRSLHEYLLWRSRGSFTYADKYGKDDPKPARRAEEVERIIAGEQLTVAKNYEAQGFFAGAANQYRLILLMDPTLEEASAGLERSRNEAEAKRLLKEGEMMILRDKWDRARESLNEGLALTEVQKEEFEDQLATIDETRRQRIFQRAIDFEHDFDFRQAIQLYEQLLDELGWYENARARRDNLVEYIAKAEELYAKAANAETDELRIAYLRQIQTFWPEYEDIRDQLERLQP